MVVAGKHTPTPLQGTPATVGQDREGEVQSSGQRAVVVVAVYADDASPTSHTPLPHTGAGLSDSTSFTVRSVGVDVDVDGECAANRREDCREGVTDPLAATCRNETVNAITWDVSRRPLFVVDTVLDADDTPKIVTLPFTAPLTTAMNSASNAMRKVDSASPTSLPLGDVLVPYDTVTVTY